MMALVLTSNQNSDSAWCNLIFTRQDDGEISPCLIGEIKGQNVQIDFDELNETDLEDFICYLQRRKEVAAKLQERKNAKS